MKLDKKNLMIIGGVLLAVGIGVYFWRKRKAESEESETIDVDAVEVDDDGNEIKKIDKWFSKCRRPKIQLYTKPFVIQNRK